MNYIVVFITLIIMVSSKIFYKYKSKSISLNKNESKINILEVANLEQFCNELSYISEVVDLRKCTPKYINICEIEGKGWGLKTNQDIKKGDLVYEVPITFFSKNYNTKIITPVGDKYISPQIHSGFQILEKDLFCYWDDLINHDNKPNSYYKNILSIKNNQCLLSLFALTNIKAGDELTINYNHLNKIYIYFNLFVHLLLF